MYIIDREPDTRLNYPCFFAYRTFTITLFLLSNVLLDSAESFVEKVIHGLNSFSKILDVTGFLPLLELL